MIEIPGHPETMDPLTDPSGKRVALIGRFGGMTRREAKNVLRSYGSLPIENDPEKADWVVIGADEPPLVGAELLSQSILESAASGRLEILGETDLWQRLGLLEAEIAIRRYHTPAMLASLLGVSIRVIRRWHRRGLISPVRTLHRLHYFDFQEVATARRLGEWIAAGANPMAIERKLVELVEVLPGIRRPLDQLSVLVDGSDLLLRHGEGLIEPNGQMRFDFDAFGKPFAGDGQENDPLDGADPKHADAPSHVLKFPSQSATSEAEQDELLVAAYAAEDRDDLGTAIDYCHAILARDGARADICFQLGELLYRLGEPIAARERYYMATELEPELVEARASLGSVLAELGDHELAIAAYRGALTLHSEYAEVHLGLAKTLDEIGESEAANEHWEMFLELSPGSPWAHEARLRLEQSL